MRPRIVATILVFGISAGAIIFSLSRAGTRPFEARLVRTEVFPGLGSKKITVGFYKNGTNAAWLDGDLKMQLRVADRWQDRLQLPGLDFMARTGQQNVEFAVPADTQACRFLVGYRVGSSPYCRTYGYLSRHGLRTKFPRLCQLAMKCVPRKAMLRHTTLELALPEARLAQLAKTS
jgi:hypothetical protein